MIKSHYSCIMDVASRLSKNKNKSVSSKHCWSHMYSYFTKTINYYKKNIIVNFINPNIKHSHGDWKKKENSIINPKKERL